MQAATAESVRDLRQRVLDGKEYTIEELRTAIQQMTGDRMKELETSAEKSQKSSSRKAAAKPVDLSEFL